jgi:CheY-like chemotaxis protein/MinD-like ATPase involved in chromosome partitioning or flagellar assembly
MPAKIMLVDDDPVTISWLKSVLEREGYTVETANRGATALQQIAQAPPDLVVLDVVLPDLDGLEILRRLRQDPSLSHLGIIVLSVKDRPQDIAAGLRVGADDYVPKHPGADIELIAKIRGLLAVPKPKAPPPATPIHAPVRGSIFSFCSPKGGTGTTALCVNTAYALAQLERGAELLVVDMNFPLGTVGQAVGFESRKTVARLSQEAKGHIDRDVAEKYVSLPQKWGFRVLLGANDPQEATGLEVSQVAPLFRTLQTMYDYILVDFGRNLSRISLPIIEISTGIVVILTPDINTVRLTKLVVEYLESLGVAHNQLMLIINRTIGRVSMSREETERELRLKLAGTIPYEMEHFTIASNEGVPFMAKFPDHTASMVFTDLARLLRERVVKR